jgi:hypothetical protein
MSSTIQLAAIKKDQSIQQGMSFHQHARKGAKDDNTYYRIVVRPKEQFSSFRTQDVGQPGGLLRLAGRQTSGTWATQAWLVSKGSAHVEGKQLIADKKDVQDLIRQLGSQPTLEKGDIFAVKGKVSSTEKKAGQKDNNKTDDTRYA